jgi:hypothetical protein
MYLHQSALLRFLAIRSSFFVRGIVTKGITAADYKAISAYMTVLSSRRFRSAARAYFACIARPFSDPFVYSHLQGRSDPFRVVCDSAKQLGVEDMKMDSSGFR